MRNKVALLNEYHNFLVRNYSKNTVDSYYYIASKLIDFCSDGKIGVKELKLSHLHLFLRRRSFSVSYLNDQIKIINNFISWCCSIGIMNRENFKRIKRLKAAAARPKIILSDFQFKMFNSLMDKVETKIKVLLKLLYFTGIKADEVINLRICDISFKNSLIIIRASETKLIRSVPIFKELEADLKSYVNSISKKNESHSFLFSKKKGGRLSHDDVYDLVSKFLRMLKGFELGPRIIRNTRGFHMLRSHENIVGISELLSVKVGQAVTYKYTDIINYSRLQGIYKTAHPKA